MSHMRWVQRVCLFWGEDTRSKRRRSICPNGATHTSPGCQPWEPHPREWVCSEGTPHRGCRGRGPRPAAMRRSFRTRESFAGWIPRVAPWTGMRCPVGACPRVTKRRSSMNLGHPLLSGLWSKEWVSHMPSHMPMRPATRPAIEWVSHMRLSVSHMRLSSRSTRHGPPSVSGSQPTPPIH